MKAFYVPTLILLFILSLALWSGSYVAQQTEDCSRQLQSADALVSLGIWEAAEDQMRQSYESWSKCQGFFHTIMEHRELDEVELLFAAAFAACDARYTPDFHTALAQLLEILHHLSEQQQVNLKNIL